MAGSKPISMTKRFGSMLTRSTSNLSESSEDGISSLSEYLTTPPTTDSECFPDKSSKAARVGSPAPLTIPKSTLSCQLNSPGIASSLFSRLSISSPRSSSFEGLQAERRRQERKQQKIVDKRIRDFHATVTGAVFIGTIVHLPVRGSCTALLPSDIECKGGNKSTPRSSTYEVGVTDITPRNPPPPKSSKAQHYDAFTFFYNQSGTLECFFDVFMKAIPREGARVSFIVTPTGEDDEYVAVACNIIDRFTPIRMASSKCSVTI